MRKQAQVIALHDGKIAELSVKRDSACGSCASCGGCDTGRILLRVKNTLDAKVGDDVIVETASKTVIAVAGLVYLLPLVLFFAGYALGAAVGLPPVLIGATGFAASLAVCVVFSRRASAKIGYQMIGFAKERP